MILRRIMEHVGKQNWFAVGIDLIVVVAAREESLIATRQSLEVWERGIVATDYIAQL